MLVLCTDCQIPQYEPLDLDKVYRIITTSFLASGGDGYEVIPAQMRDHIEGKLLNTER